MRFYAPVVVAVLVLAGCGGGGSSHVTPPAISTTSNGKVVLTIPKRASGSTARKPRYISEFTSSISVSVNGKTPIVANVGDSDPNCLNDSENATTCTVLLTAPAGHDAFTFVAYQGANATGSVLSTSVTTFTVVAGESFVLQATLNGTVASVQLDLGVLPTSGTAGTTTLTVTAYDAAGEQIVGPGNFSSPITLTVTDTTHQTTLSTSSVTAPSTPVTVSYAGGANVNATITATASGASPVSVVFTPISAGGPVYYVANANNTIVGFPLNANGPGVTPSRTVGGDMTGLGYPYGLAIDAAHNIYTDNSTATPPSITEYAPMPNGNVAPIRTIAGSLTGLSGAGSIVVDSANTIYVADCGMCFPTNGTAAILAFNFDAAGNNAPARMIAGANTQLAYAYSIALDGAGNLLVPIFYNDEVLVFPTTANGNVAPSGILGGANTGISTPSCAVTDSAGNIYVCNLTQNTISVFAPGSRGNVAPSYTIGGPNTGMGGPRMIAFDSSGYMYVTQQNVDQVFVFAPGFTGDHAPTRQINPGSSVIADPVGIVISP